MVDVRRPLCSHVGLYLEPPLGTALVGLVDSREQRKVLNTTALNTKLTVGIGNSVTINQQMAMPFRLVLHMGFQRR